jgi:hypothetical protein
LTTLEDNVGTAQLFELGMGFMSAKMLFVANEIGIFPALSGGSADLDSLAEQLGIPRRTLRMVADAMVTLGVLERDDAGRYANRPVAAALLAGDGPADARPMLRFWDQISYHAWTDLERIVRTDTPPVLHALDAERQQVFSVATRGCWTSEAVPVPSSRGCWPTIHTFTARWSMRLRSPTSPGRSWPRPMSRIASRS